jgi:pilus assembly protein CpaE
MASPSQTSDVPDTGELSVVLIGPDDNCRRAVAEALSGPLPARGSWSKQRQPARNGVLIRECAVYPNDTDDLTRVLEQDYDVIIIDLDSDLESALKAVKTISSQSTATVMVFSAKSDVDLVVRSMRAGAREFLNMPTSAGLMAEALKRASAQDPTTRKARKSGAQKLLVFLGSKGGCGVTTLASNFAVSLAQESGKSTLLIDLGVPIGDAAINLGMAPKYSTADALQDPNRLDGSFLSSLLAEHSSGLRVLAAPNDLRSITPSNAAVDRLLSVARQNFENVVVDAGSRLDLKGSAVFDDAAMIYLVTQVGISELRNANRIISQFFGPRVNPIQIVLNRYVSNSLGFDDNQITKALTMPALWKIPNDYVAAQRTRNTATAIALGDSPISRAIRMMTRAACSISEDIKKKRLFGLFG